MKYSVLLIGFFLSVLSGFSQTYYVGSEPLEEHLEPYLIVNIHTYPRFRGASVDYGQDCRLYGPLEFAKQRTRCDGLNDANGEPIELHSIGHLMNIFAGLGYELDRVFSETDPDDVFEPWQAKYVFRRK